MAVLIETIREKGAGETRAVIVSFLNVLRGNDRLTGTPTVVEVTTSALTLASKTLNSASEVVDDQVVPINAAVKFTVAGGSAGTTYKIKITVSSVNGETYVKVVRILVNADDGT